MRLCAILLFLVMVLLVVTCGCMQSPSPRPAGPVNTTTVAQGNGTWKFVVFGDSPDNSTNTATGISRLLKPIAAAVAAEKPDLIMYTGDLVSGWLVSNKSLAGDNYSTQFENWMEAVSPIRNFTNNTGIPLYVIRGNHEDGPNQTVVPLLDAYLATVASGMPTNGPPGEEKLTYSFTYKGMKVIASDNYIAHNGRKETVNQTWVDGQLTEATRPFIFVFGHSPAYLVDDDKEDLPYSLSTRPAERDIFWESLVKNHVSAYICGHAHLYVRGVSQGVRQIVSGNGGAPMQGFDPGTAEKGLTIEYPVQAINQSDQKVGYLIITVNETVGMWSGVQKTMDPVTGNWTTGDMFTFPARSG